MAKKVRQAQAGDVNAKGTVEKAGTVTVEKARAANKAMGELAVAMARTWTRLCMTAKERGLMGETLHVA